MSAKKNIVSISYILALNDLLFVVVIILLNDL